MQNQLRLFIGVLLLCNTRCIFAAEWITAPSYYTHSPETGQRVNQHTPIEPVYGNVRSDFLSSGYRHTRSSIQAGGSIDHLHIVEEWGRPVRPYEEWRYPFRPYSVPYNAWGPQPVPGIGILPYGYGNGFNNGYNNNGGGGFGHQHNRGPNGGGNNGVPGPAGGGPGGAGPGGVGPGGGGPGGFYPGGGYPGYYPPQNNGDPNLLPWNNDQYPTNNIYNPQPQFFPQDNDRFGGHGRRP